MSKPYTNEVQRWLGEAEAAVWFLVGMYVGAVLAGIYFYTQGHALLLVFLATVAATAASIHYWRVAPEMRE